MKTITASFFTAAWLYTSVLCDNQIQPGIQRRQQLSDILANLLPQQGNQNFDAVKALLPSNGNAGGATGAGGAITVTVDDVFGTRSQQAAPSSTNRGAIWVSSSIGGGGERTSAAGGGSPTEAPAQGGTTTIQSTISMTTTLILASSALAPPFPANTSVPVVGGPVGSGSTTRVTFPLFRPTGTGGLPAQPVQPTNALPVQSTSALPVQPTGTGGLPAQPVQPTNALPVQPTNALPTSQPIATQPLQGNAGSIPPIVQSPSAAPGLPVAAPNPATGGALPPILLPTNVPSGVFPPGAPAGGANPAVGGTLPPVLKPTNAPVAVAPTPVQSGALASGIGTIINGQCQCACNCPTNAFPSQVAAPIQSAPAAIPTIATTLQTIILSSSVSQPLPGSLLVDTSLAPPLPTPVSQIAPSAQLPSSSIPIVSPPAQVTPPSLPTSALPVVAEPQREIQTISTIPQAAPVNAPAPTPPPLPTVAPSINISTFSLVSSLVLALGG